MSRIRSNEATDAQIQMLVSKLSRSTTTPTRHAQGEASGLRRHGAPWTTSEDALVQLLHSQGRTMVAIAGILQRSAHAVQIRYRHLAAARCFCGQVLPPQKSAGRRRLFCSERCQRKAARLRRRTGVMVHLVPLQPAGHDEAPEDGSSGASP